MRRKPKVPPTSYFVSSSSRSTTALVASAVSLSIPRWLPLMRRTRYGSDLPFELLVEQFRKVRFPALAAKPWQPGQGYVTLKAEA